MDFLQDLISYSFLYYSLAAIVLISISCGTIGSFVVVRRATYVTGSLAHCVVAGIGFARFAQVALGWQWLDPMLGAVSSALLSAILISWVEHSQSERVDSILSIIWAVGMAVGLCFLAATPGYNNELMSYLLGDILLVNFQDLLWMGLISAATVGIITMRFDTFVGTSFQKTLMEIRGVSTLRYHLLFNLLAALVVVAVVKLVGIMLAVAFIAIPASTATRWHYQLKVIIPIAIGLCLLSGILGLWLSYQTNWPTGATTVLCTTLLYGLSALLRNRR
jgi:zinc transport system permease protein